MYVLLIYKRGITMKRSIKISVFILILVMSFLYLLPSKTIMADTDYSYIRVKLSISQPSVSIEVDGEYIIDEDPSIDVKKGDYTLTVSGSKVNIKGKDLNKSFNNSLPLPALLIRVVEFILRSKGLNTVILYLEISSLLQMIKIYWSSIIFL